MFSHSKFITQLEELKVSEWSEWKSSLLLRLAVKKQVTFHFVADGVYNCSNIYRFLSVCPWHQVPFVFLCTWHCYRDKFLIWWEKIQRLHMTVIWTEFLIAYPSFLLPQLPASWHQTCWPFSFGTSSWVLFQYIIFMKEMSVSKLYNLSSEKNQCYPSSPVHLYFITSFLRSLYQLHTCGSSWWTKMKAVSPQHSMTGNIYFWQNIPVI